jgi:hypothetical protein
MWLLDIPEDEVDFHNVYGLDEDALEITFCARLHSLLPGSTTGNYILMLQELLGSLDLGDIHAFIPGHKQHPKLLVCLFCAGNAYALDSVAMP